MLPQVQVLGGVYPGDCGHENPGAGSVRLDHLKTVVLILQTRVSEVRSPWKVWTCDPKYTIWGRLSPWRLWTCGHQVQGMAGGVTMETVDILPQVQGLGGVSTWILWTCYPRCRV